MIRYRHETDKSDTGVIGTQLINPVLIKLMKQSEPKHPLLNRPPMDMTPTALAEAAKAVAAEIPGVVVSEHIVRFHFTLCINPKK